MTAEAPRPAADVVCPYLGLIDDRATRFTFPSVAHRCHATERPSTIDIAKQGRDCLTAEHVTCPRYRPPKVLAATVAMGQVQVVPHVVAAGRPGRSHRGRHLVRVAIVAIALIGTALVGLLLGAGLATQLTGGAATPLVPTGAPPSASTALPTPSPTRTPSPTPSRSPSPSPSPSPTASPTASPTTRPAATKGPIVHVVQRGETLTSIAAEYGVTVDALKALNEIEDPNLIFVGQELVIPGA